MDLQEIISQMTLEEKAGLCSGENFWWTKAVQRLSVPSFMVSDGPHGLRKQKDTADHLGINDSIEAVCFPTGSCIASSFDKALIRQMGEAIGDECQAEGVAVCLGPAVNIKRSPLCGRNFEYLSEDPYLTSEMATAYIQGVQSKNVGTSIKHFLANNQEHRRMTSSSNIDERTLREIYMAAFEGPVIHGKPWTVMCSYNRVNGEYASQSRYYLTNVLRKEWGFDGFVISDWGAVRDKVKSLQAGMDLEMPSTGGISDAKIVQAVKEGKLDESVVDKVVYRILKVLYQFQDNRDRTAIFDRDAHHQLARDMAAQSMVLLKNDHLLPLNASQKIAFIGKFAQSPRYQGGGSSHIQSHKVTSAMEAASDYATVTYAQGYDIKENQADESLLQEAIQTAAQADVAVVFVGLPDSFESEGYDRSHMSLPACQTRLVNEILTVQPNVVVVLHNGSPVEMPWVNQVKAILEVYLGGQAVGGATADILFGQTNPSGKLAETFPCKLEDNPSYLYYTGEGDDVDYREGVFIGYRYYDKKKIHTLFPFGHGLSYTTFAYSNLRLSEDKILDTDTLVVQADITNTGTVAGKEVIQLYVSPQDSTIIRPEKELKGFEKISLNPGETKTVTFTLSKRAFAYYCTQISDWRVESGDYQIILGRSSTNLPLQKTIHVTSTDKVVPVFNINSTIGDILAVPKNKAIMEPVFADLYQLLNSGGESDHSLGESTSDMMAAMVDNMPLGAIISFGNGQISEETVKSMIDQINVTVSE